MISASESSAVWKRIRNILRDAKDLGPFNADYAEAFGMAMVLHITNSTDLPAMYDSQFHKVVDEERERRVEMKIMSQSVSMVEG